MNKYIKLGLMISVLCIILASVALAINNKKNYLPYNQFMMNVDQGIIKEVVIKSEERVEFYINDTGYYTDNPERDDFKEYLLLNGLKVKNTYNILGGVISFGIIIGVFAFVYFILNKGMTKDKQIVNNIKDSQTFKEQMIKFDQVAGNFEAKEMLSDIIQFIKEPDSYFKVGAKMPKGVLLYGPPGTGKTLLARAIAGEADVPFYAMSGSDFVQMYVGVGAKRVRELFKKARKSEKAIIFIDEIDAIGKSRGNNAGSANDERDQTLNALLTEMSGFNDRNGIVVIAATNRVDTLDKALLRPGRFDRQIEVALPDAVAREKIISLYLKDRMVDDRINIVSLAKKTGLFSGAMLANLINEAAIITANNKEDVITVEAIDKAFYYVIAGRDKIYKEKFLGQDNMKITAIHEAGHALMTKLLMPQTMIDKVTIIPTTNGAAGYNYNIKEDIIYKTRKGILEEIKVLLGGRAAEEIILGHDQVTSGCINDIKSASKQLIDYFKHYGMDEAYGLFSSDELNDDSLLIHKCRDKLSELYEETKGLINEHINQLELISDALLKYETLTGRDLERLLIED